MRFLFGDSTPFEGGYDALDALRQWVDASVELLQTARTIEEAERRLGQRTQDQLHEIQAVSDFFEGAVQRVAEQAARSAQPDRVAPHARDLIEQIENAAASARERSATAMDADRSAVTEAIETLASSLRERLGRYLRSGALPSHEWELTLRYGTDHAQGAVALHYAEEIDARFDLELDAHETWSRPRRLRELCPELAIEVGLKKAFLRSTLAPEVVPLDELYLMRLELGAERAALHLRRRPDGDEPPLVVEVDMVDGPVAGRVRRGGDSADAHPSPESDHVHLRRLHEALRTHAFPLTQHEGALTAARLDEEKRPIRGELVRAILRRIGARMAPTLLAVFEHSPNADELSLKREHDDGHREELYLRIDELRKRLGELPAEELRLHAVIPFLVADEGTGEGPDAPAAPQVTPERA